MSRDGLWWHWIFKYFELWYEYIYKLPITDPVEEGNYREWMPAKFIVSIAACSYQPSISTSKRWPASALPAITFSTSHSPQHTTISTVEWPSGLGILTTPRHLDPKTFLSNQAQPTNCLLAQRMLIRFSIIMVNYCIWRFAGLRQCFSGSSSFVLHGIHFLCSGTRSHLPNRIRHGLWSFFQFAMWQSVSDWHTAPLPACSTQRT